MKTLLATFLFFGLSILTWASSAVPNRFLMQCGLKRPQTMISLLFDSEKGTTLRWAVEGGVLNLPLTNSSVSAPMLPLIQYQIDDLKRFPAVGEIHWKAEQCKATEVGILECNGEGESKSLPFQSLRLSTWQKNIRGASAEFFSWQIQWAITTESNTYFVPFEFDEASCAVQPLEVKP